MYVCIYIYIYIILYMHRLNCVFVRFKLHSKLAAQTTV